MFHADDRIESFWLWFDLNERQNVLNIFKPGQPRGTTTGIAFTRFLLSLARCNAVGLRSRRARTRSSLRHHDRRFWPPGPFALCHKYYVRADDARVQTWCAIEASTTSSVLRPAPAPTRAAMHVSWCSGVHIYNLHASCSCHVTWSSSFIAGQSDLQNPRSLI